MKNRIVIGVLTVVMLACSSSKKTQTSNAKAITIEDPAINLDTIRVVANPTPKKKIYRESNPLITDISHTSLEVSFDWQNSRLNGKAHIYGKPYFYPTNVVYLNARGFDIKGVSVSIESVATSTRIVKGKKTEVTESSFAPPRTAVYFYQNDSLKINLGREVKPTESFYIQIEYTAKPNELKKGGSDAISDDKGLYFINPKGEDPNKMPQIWTQGETQSSSAWFPCVDSPNEKMTSEIYMTVDDKYTTLSNGLLLDSKKNTDGTRIDHWKMDLPHSPYLVMMGVGEFKKVTDEPWKGKEISYYVEKEYEPHAKAIFGNTKEMIDFYSKKMGVDYPWQKYSQIVARDYVSGAMENTTATLHGDFMVYQTTREMIDGKKGEDVIAHELFHQWFGDLVTAESWSNLPLNESFATYGEYLWEEYKYGRDAADDHHASSRFGYFASSERKEVDLVRFDYENREDMFDAFSYNKGGQVLHMLRKIVGDDAFFASLKLYLESRSFKPGEIHHLRLAFEDVTGKDMNWFFNQWFLAKGHPILNVTKNYDEASHKLFVKVEQKQDFTEVPLYKLPINIDIYWGGKVDRQLVWVEEASQTFTFDFATAPNLVNFDSERQLLAKIKYEKTKEEYLFQAANAPLWGDRDEALNYFSKKLSDKDIYEAVKKMAQSDKWSGIRLDAVSYLGDNAKGTEEDLKSLLVNIANNDANTKVRAEVIHGLSLHFKGEDLNALYEKGLSEQSYAINGESLEAMTKVNPTVASQKAKTLENETGKKLIYAIADLYSNHGSDENAPFYAKAKTQFNGFELLGFASIYGKFLKRCTKPETAIAGANDLAGLTKGGNKYVKYGALRVLKTNLVENYEGRESKLKSNIEAAKKENKDVTAMNAELKTVTETKNKLTDIYNSVK
ncbi:MAG: M1 family peptidase [Sphingobacteriaceae bacterium]|nr:M1 family peptidase [Sphingobacteriaceae bacterium]